MKYFLLTILYLHLTMMSMINGIKFKHLEFCPGVGDGVQTGGAGDGAQLSCRGWSSVEG